MAYHQDLCENTSAEECAALCTQARALLAHFEEERAITANERLVLEHRFALDGQGNYRTYEEIAPLLSVTRERIRQILVKAIRRLKRQSEFVQLMQSYLAVVSIPPELVDAAERLTTGKL